VMGSYPRFPRQSRQALSPLIAFLEGQDGTRCGGVGRFFSFAAERAGASRVVAADGPVWDNRTWSSKAGFELARGALGSRVEDRQLNFYEIPPERVAYSMWCCSSACSTTSRIPFLLSSAWPLSLGSCSW
jgi:hypothetical protein